jgi:hypothetical protein
VAGSAPFETHNPDGRGIDAQLVGDLGHRQPWIVTDVVRLYVGHSTSSLDSAIAIKRIALS